MAAVAEGAAAGRTPGGMLFSWKYRQTWSGTSARTCLASAAGDAWSNTHTYTHTHLMALFPGLPGSASTRKVEPIWILLKRDSEWQWH